jgi:hypothetical protein
VWTNQKPPARCPKQIVVSGNSYANTITHTVQPYNGKPQFVKAGFILMTHANCSLAVGRNQFTVDKQRLIQLEISWLHHKIAINTTAHRNRTL